MPYTLTDTERQREIDMVQNPDEWPRWPYLPMKKHVKDGAFPLFGWLCDTGTSQIGVTLYSGDFATDRKLENVQTTHYTDPAAMIDDGWVID
jgi:hypothetical protein